MQIANELKKHKRLLLIAGIIIAIVFAITLFKTFSETVTDDGWDGVVARTFTSGTGTEENPFVIANASEYAYFKQVMEGDDASFYANKTYVITNNFNYNNYDISINNQVPFSGKIKGTGKVIANAKSTNSLFASLDGAEISNIKYTNLQVEVTEDTAIFSKTANNSAISTLIIEANVSAIEANNEEEQTLEEYNLAALILTDTTSSISNVILNITLDENIKYANFITSPTDTTITNVLINDELTSNNELQGVSYYSINKVSNNDLVDFANDIYKIVLDNNDFVIETIKKNGSSGSKGPNRSVVQSDTITPHNSGQDGTTFYVNDLTADLNYLTGLNYAEVRSTSLPSGVSTGYYNSENLVKVEIIYDGQDINVSSRVGALSPINNENTNKFVYYKYYALQRNSDGTLATNSDGDNFIRIELIDNPFTKRPYTTSGNTTTEYGFNGWACNQNVDTTAGLCENSVINFKKADYTRYMDVPVNGGSELIIHLNATWYTANVVTNYNNIGTLKTMAMEPTFYTVSETVSHYGRAYWRQNYAQMVFLRTYVRRDDANGYMPAGTWYKTTPNGTTYTYNSYSRRCSYNTTCYTYTANTAGIVADTEYTGGSVKIVTNFNATGNNTETTINNFNWTYMYIIDNPNGPYSHTGPEDVPYSYLPTNMNVSGFYYKVSNPTQAMIDTGEYYDVNGSLCTSTSSCTTAYKLIQYNDSVTNSNGNSIYLTETLNNKIVDTNKYYYLITRDMNIFRYTYTGSRGNNNNNDGLSMSYLNSNRPFTVTGTAVNGTSATGILSTYSNNLTVANDLVIENIRIYGRNSTGSNNLALGENDNQDYTIYANSHNLKIGRNITSSRGTNYIVAETIMGGTRTSVTGTFRVIVESGFYYAYQSGAFASAGYGGTSNYTLNETTILGNDYDRILNNNSKLKFLIGIDGYAAGSHTAGSDSLFASYNIIKSGSYGYNANGSASTDTTSGLYIGGRSSTCVNSLTGAKIEGGLINLIIGGYGYNGSTSTNSSYIGMSGGTVRSIYGGAGHSTTKGNRIINATGGTVSCSILGGSDSYNSGSNNDGVVQGSTLVYVGGNVTVGGGSTVQGVDPGSVFGAGGGQSGSGLTSKGTVYNSHVIINGGTISDSVYGGGNFGSTGTQYAAASTTVVDIYSGTIGNVFGGSKSANFSQNNYRGSSTIDINMTGGTVGNLYGGSDAQGTVYGSVDIDITGGSITTNVYGGGKGASTFVSNDVDVTIGTSGVSNTPTIGGSVYGGSALGTVNSTATNGTAYGNTTVTVNNGIITGSVFGGGEGDATTNPVTTPYVLGNITVTINDGDVTSVFGGNDQAGSHTKQNEVHLNGGVVGTAYGGGNKSSVTTTHVYLSGSDVGTIYGGSNTSGDVTTTNVAISSGSVQTVYGGNNEGGTCGTTNVTVQGTASVNGSIYGGGNEVATTTTNVTLNSAGSTIPAIYGGGNSASVGTANITQNGLTVTNMYGGSNSSGTVTNSYINYNSGSSTNVYGGNNAGGNTVTSHVAVAGGTIGTVYGGGNQANGGTSNITMTNGTVTTIFGGGNSAGLDESNVSVTGGTVTDIYGGSNTTGTVDETNIIYNKATGTTNSIYGGGNRAEVGDTNITFTTGTVGNIYGGGNLAQATGDTIVDINGGTINTNVYGGGNQAQVGGDTTVTITNATVLGSAYAGGNGVTAIVNGNTSITIDGTTVIGTNQSVPPHTGSVFGGGNQAATGTANDSITSTVKIVGGTIYGNVYGGANTSVINGNTSVNIGYQALDNTLTKSDIYIKGHVFGGGEANAAGSENYDWNFISVTEGTNIIVDGTSYNDLTVGGSFYGGGNASSASGDSYLLIKHYGTRSAPKTNISIQRVKYVTIDNSYILLKGAIDRANEYNTELFSVSRVEYFTIKNNTDIYFETGANLLEDFSSLDSSGNEAVVTINTNTNTLTRTVDNRVYMYEGKNLNIAHNQQVTEYGEVHGMSFLGIYNYDNNHNINTGIYHNSYDPGDTLDWAGTFSRGSYVLGAHVTNHDITADGFYSNFINEETAINEVDYIEPTPTSGRFYMWFIGENVIEYNVNLVASKYSTLGAAEVSFLDFYKPNTSFQILSLDSSEIASGISLIDKNNIPRIANTEADANSKFGLSMEATNNGWLTTGKTNFYTTEPSLGGTTYYEGENSNVVPTMLFYLYHSKNISLTQDLGTVRISIMSITKINALSNEVKRLVVNVNMSTAMFQTVEYEGAMTPGDKYELFASTDTNITTKSKFSAYYSIYASNTNLYPTGYHRVLSSTYVLPVGTKITMLDFGEGTPQYYYHVINQTDYNNALAEFNLENECSYAFSLFTRMGSKSNNSNYDDAAKNQVYYDGTNSFEEFIFIVDFSDTTITQNQLDKKLVIVLRDANDEDIKSVLGIQHSQLTYNLYANSDSQLDVTITPSDNPLYIGYSDIFDTVIDYESTTLNGVTITDTQYFDYKLGAQIYIKNSQGNVISGTDLTGTYFMVDNTIYYPDINGYTHIKLANKVGNTQKWLIFNTDNSTLASGSYTFYIEIFASPDGIYYSDATPSLSTVPITIISSVYGLNPVIDDDSVIFSSNNDKDLEFTITYTSLLNDPNIRIAMYRRKYDLVYDTNYELVDLQDYVDQQLFGTSNTYEYLLVDDPNPTNDFVIAMNDQLLTGTYRLAFRLYDNDTLIGEIIRYIIIR